MLSGIQAGGAVVAGSVSDPVSSGAEPETFEQHRAERAGSCAAGGLWNRKLFYGEIPGRDAMYADGIPAEEQRNLTGEPFGRDCPNGSFYMGILLFDLKGKGWERGM